MVYDLDVLRRGRESIKANIVAIEDALAHERERLSEYEREIAAAEAILKLHGR